MRLLYAFVVITALSGQAAPAPGTLTTGGQPAELQIRLAGDNLGHKIRHKGGYFPATPAVVDRPYPAPVIRLRSLVKPMEQRVGRLTVAVKPNPLTVTVTNASGQLVQELVFEADGTLAYKLDDQPVLGLGEGGPRPAQGTPWREQALSTSREVR